MKILWIVSLLFLTGCVNVNINYYQVSMELKEEVSEQEEWEQQEVESDAELPPIINPPILSPIIPSEPLEEEIPILSFLEVVSCFKSVTGAYSLNYFTPLSVNEIYGISELNAEEFIGGNQLLEQGIYEAVVFKAREGMAEQVVQKVNQRQAFLLAQYPEAMNVQQAVILRIDHWVIYSALEENQALIDALQKMINNE